MDPFTNSLRDAADTFASEIRKFCKNHASVLGLPELETFKKGFMKSFTDEEKKFKNFSATIETPMQEYEKFLIVMQNLSLSSFRDLRTSLNPAIDICLDSKTRQNLQKIVSDGKNLVTDCYKEFSNQLQKVSNPLQTEITKLNKAVEKFVVDLPTCGRLKNPVVAEKCTINLVSFER